MSETVVVPSSVPTPVRGVPPRTGFGTTTWILLRWTLASTGAMLPLFLVVQAAFAAGIIIGFGFLIPGIDASTAAFLSTGAPTVLIMITGLVLCPFGVATARTSGTFTYQRALPVPRPLLLATDTVVWLIIVAPAVPVTVLVAQLRYGFAYSIDWPLLIGAVVLSTVMATWVGYAFAVLVAPALAQLISQVLVFFVMLFSPITFPAAQLPVWFQAVHDVLPFRPAADLMRAGLLSDTYEASLRDVVVVLIWCLLGLAVSVRALVRRD